MKQKAWVVSVEMGYGHMRAARPLRGLAEGGEIIAADNYEGIPERDLRLWARSRKFYGLISRLKDEIPFGQLIFDAFDYFQRIEDVNKRQVEPTLQLRQEYSLIRSGWGKHLIEKLNENPLPLVTAFFTVGHMAEVWGYEGEIYILATDSDVSRAWAPLEPQKSRINYLAPTKTVLKHLKNYGVSPQKINLTGFPLPEELVAKAPLFKNKKRLTVTFAIGGAGAQADVGRKIIKGLEPLMAKGEAVLNLILGTNRNLVSRFKEGPGVRIFSCESKEEYFSAFNEIIAETDVLWTKPSELSFYAALGLPIIIAPPIGAQEKKNREWLLKLGAGIDEGKPGKAHEWLPKLLESGALARAAKAGFMNIEKNAAENISKVVFSNKT